MLEPREAEVAAECYWLTQGAVLTRRVLRTKWARVDFFAADVVAIFPNGGKAWTQVTTAQRGESIRRRRRKLEAVPWHGGDTVFLFEVEERPGVVRRGSKDYYFRVHEYTFNSGRLGDGSGTGLWLDVMGPRVWKVQPEPIPIPRAWLLTSTAKKLGRRDEK